MQENQESEYELKPANEPPSDEPKKRKVVNFNIPTDELEKIKQEYGVDDVAGAIIYQYKKKNNPSVATAIRKITKKDKPQNPTTKPEGIYVPEGVEDVLKATGEITAEALKKQFEEADEKKRKYEEIIEQQAMQSSEEKKPDIVEKIVEQYVSSAIETEKKLKEKALKDLLEKPEKKEPDLNQIIEKVKQSQPPPEKDKELEKELLTTVKQELLTQLTERLKAQGKITPEAVGQIINGVSSIVDKLEPIFTSLSTKQSMVASREKIVTLAQIMMSINADSVRTMREMMQLLKDNSEMLKNPVMLKIVESMMTQNQFLLKSLQREILPESEPQTPPKKKEVVDLKDIPKE
jgi:sulfur transfer protein SufE